MRRLAVLLPLALVAVLAAGCGESDKDKYIDDYKPLNNELIEIGQKLNRAVQNADTQTDAQLAATFERLGDELQQVGDDIADLDTPDDLKDESDRLTRRIDAAVGDINDISKAAATHNEQAAASATVSLGAVAVAINTAQNRLARATGANVGRG